MGPFILFLLGLWLLSKSGALLRFVLMIVSVVATIMILGPIALGIGAIIIILLLFIAIAEATKPRGEKE